MPWTTETQFASATYPNASLDGFVAQCGLISFLVRSLDPAGEIITSSPPTPSVSVTLAPGGYKGVAAIPMGQ